MAAAAAASTPPATSVVVAQASLYVGDLHPDVTDGQLYDAFSEFKSLASVRICRDSSSGRSLCYGYVNFIAAHDAIRAIETKNHTQLNGTTIRVTWSNRDSDFRKSGVGNVFVKNLCDSIDSGKLQEIFGKFGGISSCKVATTEEGKSKGYGFVQFIFEDSANAAIEKLSGTSVAGKHIYVGKFLKKSERLLTAPEIKYTNLYMKNLDSDITEEVLLGKFSQFGKIVSLAIARNEKGASKGFAFVNFDNSDDARKVVETMNGSQLGSRILYVARAQKKLERKQILRRQFEEKRREQILKYKGSNVYIKNIHDDMDDEELRKLFSQCGTITSAKIMRDGRCISKGFGFVCYSAPGEADKAVNTFHGYMCYQKPLYVAIAQRKEDRQAQMQIQIAQRLTGFPGPSPPLVPGGYPLVYFTPAMVPQVPQRQGLMYQPLGIRPGWRGNRFGPVARPAFQPPLPPMMTSHARHKRQNNRNRMNGNILPQHGVHMQSDTSPIGSTNQQRNEPVKFVPNGRSEMSEISGTSSTFPTFSGISTQSSENWSSMVADAEPGRQKQMIGERLYPLVQKHRPDLVGKITGMLVDGMDCSELLVLISSPDSLAAKVQEAVEVLKLSKTKVPSQDAIYPGFHEVPAH